MTMTRSTFTMSNTPDVIYQSLITAYDNLMLCYANAEFIAAASNQPAEDGNAVRLLLKARDCFESSFRLVQGVDFCIARLKEKSPEEYWTDEEWSYFTYIQKNIADFNAVLSSPNFCATFSPCNPSSYHPLIDAFDQLIVFPFPSDTEQE